MPLKETSTAGTVPLPVASMMAGLARSRSQWIVIPLDLWPSSRISWKILAAQAPGMRILLPQPSTLVWQSLVDLFGGAATNALVVAKAMTSLQGTPLDRNHPNHC
ncbi:unnamed protein product [Fraxinus pennsylvanica]|uniref:Uncharacterized protein n=1 Tax=Fraxinus pennsylvanica TaxID=56036 RepID=A0AAD2DM81_9LAMI|nr:unnamed protein product [Fraxinus pennsylvanica]